MRHIQNFSGGPKSGVFGGGQKSLCRKNYVLVLSPCDGVNFFGSGRPPRYPPGRPRDIPLAAQGIAQHGAAKDIPPKHFMFRLLLCS